MALTILQQILIMALYMLIGYTLFRTGKITEAGSRSIANMLAWAVIPSMIINSFLVEFSPERIRSLGWSFAAAALSLALSMAISAVLFRRSGVDQFASAFSNAGFIGIPLIQAALGDEGVFFLAGMLVLLNLLQWTYGAWLLMREKPGSKRAGLDVRGILLSPVVLATAAGLVLFLTGLGNRLPAVLSGCIKGVAALNAPLAMITLGIYLAQVNLTELFTTKRLYRVSAVRLLFIPLVTVLLFAFLPLPLPVRMTMLIAGAAPVGANVAVYSQIYDADYVYACMTVTQSTLFSIITMPVVIMIAEMILR